MKQIWAKMSEIADDCICQSLCLPLLLCCLFDSIISEREERNCWRSLQGSSGSRVYPRNIGGEAEMLLEGRPVYHTAPLIHIWASVAKTLYLQGSVLGSERKPENPEETQINTGRTWKIWQRKCLAPKYDFGLIFSCSTHGLHIT